MKKSLASVLFLGALALGGAAYAMPTPAELEKARTEVARALEAKRGDYVKKRITGEAFADYALELVPEVGNDAERFLLYKDAVYFYARAAAYDKAVAAAENLLKDVKDIPDETFLALLRDALVKSRKEGGALATFYETRREQAARARKVSEAKSAYDRKPSDPVLQTQYAEALALAGRWKEALPVFAQADGPVGKMAQAERNGFKGGVTRRAAGDFWWGYVVAGEPGDKVNGIKRHAAELYEQAVIGGEVTGLAVKNVEFRIEKAALRKIGAYDWHVPSRLKQPRCVDFRLEAGRTISFLSCPRGAFRMSDAVLNCTKREVGTHVVELSYTFWMARTCISVGEWADEVGFSDNTEKKCAYSKMAVALEDQPLNVAIMWSARGFRKYCEHLTAKYADQIPRGWVFRPPTEAEYEYAALLQSPKVWKKDVTAGSSGPAILRKLGLRDFLKVHEQTGDIEVRGACIFEVGKEVARLGFYRSGKLFLGDYAGFGRCRPGRLESRGAGKEGAEIPGLRAEGG